MLCEVSGPFSQPELVLLNLPLSLFLYAVLESHVKICRNFLSTWGVGFFMVFRFGSATSLRGLAPFLRGRFLSHAWKILARKTAKEARDGISVPIIRPL